jgi:cell division septum initiation protein DivIVA
MALRRRDKSGGESSRPTYASLGSRIEYLLRLAEEQRDQIITEARHEAAVIVDDARRQAEEILASARAQAGQLAGGAVTEPGAGQEGGLGA